MRILHIGFYRNEVKWIKPKLDWHVDQLGEAEYFVIVNECPDTERELMRLGIAHKSFDTDSIYNLPALQKEMFRWINLIKPDWVVYLSADNFIRGDMKLREAIEIADERGYNCIDLPVFTTYKVKTGENHFGVYYDSIVVVWKHYNGVSFVSDRIIYKNPLKFRFNGVLVNYGNLEPNEKREDELMRRKKAWDSGKMSRSEGIHLQRGKDHNWVWDKKELTDLSKYNNWKYVEQLTKEVTNGR